MADGRVASVPHAREDLDAGVLRVLHDRSFADDPTRLLRLARYAARLGFAAEPHTAALAAAADMAGVSGERHGRGAAAAAARAAARGAPRRSPATRPALLPGLDPDPAPDRRRRSPRRRPTPAATSLALAAAWPPDDDAAAGARLHRRRPPHPRRRRAARRSCGPRSTAPTRPSAVRRVLDREPVEAAVLAGGEQAARWIAEWRHARPAITGRTCSLRGWRARRSARGSRRRRTALLDGRAPDRESQLAVALERCSATPATTS